MKKSLSNTKKFLINQMQGTNSLATSFDSSLISFRQPSVNRHYDINTMWQVNCQSNLWYTQKKETYSFFWADTGNLNSMSQTQSNQTNPTHCSVVSFETTLQWNPKFLSFFNFNPRSKSTSSVHSKTYNLLTMLYP